jgi:CPA2 family monovalent cation:H+ antiporter-2
MMAMDGLSFRPLSHTDPASKPLEMATRSVCESGRKLNPSIAIIARAYSEEEESFLRSCGATTVIRGEQEIGKGILAFLRSDEGNADMGPTPLPMAENVLATAGAGSVAVEPVAGSLDISEPEIALEPPEAPVVPDVTPERLVEADPPPVSAVAIDEAYDSAAETIEIEPVAEVDAEPSDDAIAADVEETPVLGEAPPAIDEIVPPPVAAEPETQAEPTLPVDAEEPPEPLEPAEPVEPQDPAQPQKPDPESVIETSEGDPEEEKSKDSVIPEVRPEPKS